MMPSILPYRSATRRCRDAAWVFLVITPMYFPSATFASGSTASETSSEAFVLDHLTKGEIADLAAQPDRTIRAAFLTRTLRGDGLKDVPPSGIRIRNAEVIGDILAQNV